MGRGLKMIVVPTPSLDELLSATEIPERRLIHLEKMPLLVSYLDTNNFCLCLNYIKVVAREQMLFKDSSG